MKYVMFLYIDPSDKIIDWYRTSIQTRNPDDSGFDLFNPEQVTPLYHSCFKIDYRVKCAMYELGDISIENALEQRNILKPQAFYLYARSSIAKTNYRLSNGVGIIDRQYRGNIGAYFDEYVFKRDTDPLVELPRNMYMRNTTISTPIRNEHIEEKTRLVQLCHPTLEPFHIIMVNSVEELGTTRRGTGGFGSTGV